MSIQPDSESAQFKRHSILDAPIEFIKIAILKVDGVSRPLNPTGGDDGCHGPLPLFTEP